MSGIKYDDIYKFLVSLGIALIGLAVLIPWLFLREPFDLLLSTDTFDNLTEEAQTVIAYRQGMVSWILTFMPCLSGLLCLVGLLATVGGLFFWVRRQIVLDKQQEVTLKKSEIELQAMSQADVTKKVAAEAAGVALMDNDLELQPATPPQASNEIISKYLKVEEEVTKRIKECLGAAYDVRSNQSIRSAQYDIVLIAQHPPIEDIIIEIKYAERGFRGNWVKDNTVRTILAASIYSEATRREARSIILIIAPRDTLSRIGQRAQRYEESALEEAVRLGGRANVIIIAREDINSLKCSDLCRRLGL